MYIYLLKYHAKQLKLFNLKLALFVEHEYKKMIFQTPCTYMYMTILYLPASI